MTLNLNPSGGPGITPGSTWDKPATQVDLAPTFLGIAGLEKPSHMDGKSLLPLLVSSEDEGVQETTRKHLTAMGPAERYAAVWRDAAFIEYYFVAPNIKCVEGCNSPGGLYPKEDSLNLTLTITITLIGGFYPKEDSYCTDLIDNTKCWGPSSAGCNVTCYPTESIDNNFIALRHVSHKGRFGNTLYAKFAHGNQDNTAVDFSNPNFHEYYHVQNDPWQMKNEYSETSKATIAELDAKLQKWYTCEGDSCP